MILKPKDLDDHSNASLRQLLLTLEKEALYIRTHPELAVRSARQLKRDQRFLRAELKKRGAM